ncbi:IclR family transcriptional regulator [Rhodococcus sp. JVH1]|uniref:IclR family transcriptional regulator n=1 Tax=Rhodococcus sp. JVH1 TaxID=745408 RepID=UPI000272178F|nr:IclR family transcriptional regulator [Rhodococcus sp. JVH1]EJI98853.1 bacterial transcriptional regulator family protein [Rhodococcus sp. JVH1]
MSRTPTGESVTARVVRVLSSFDADTPSLSVSDIARRSDLPVATAHRIVGELVKYRLLERNDTRISIGVRMWELGSRGSHTLSLREAAMPLMEDVNAAIKQHTQLGILDGNEVLFVERLSTRGSVVNVTKIAGRLPVHACSSGLVLMANASRDVQDELLSQPLERYTDATVTDPDQMRRLLAEVRHQHFAVAAGLITPGATGVAVPVRDTDGGRVIAALSVVIPHDQANPQSVVAALTTASRGITRAMTRGSRH